MIEKSLLDSHLQYTAWATDRLLKAIAAIPAGQLTYDFKTSDGTIINTLAHIFAADRVWLNRVNGRRPAVFIEDRDRDLAVLRTEWPAVHEEWRYWLGAQS